MCSAKAGATSRSMLKSCMITVRHSLRATGSTRAREEVNLGGLVGVLLGHFECGYTFWLFTLKTATLVRAFHEELPPEPEAVHLRRGLRSGLTLFFWLTFQQREKNENDRRKLARHMRDDVGTAFCDT